MSELMQVTGIGFFAGMLGILTGGLVSPRTGRRRFFHFINRLEGQPHSRLYDIFAEFAAGLLIAVICFDLLPEAFLLGGLINSLLGIFLGLLFMLIFQNILVTMRMKRGTVSRCFWLEISLFCIPAGLALGASYPADGKIAAAVTLAIVLNSIPEGIRYLGNDSAQRGQMIGIAASYSLLTAFGSFAGAFLTAGSGNGTSLLLSISGGALLYLCAGVLLREDGTIRGRLPAVLHILGILLGLLLAVCT